MCICTLFVENRQCRLAGHTDIDDENDTHYRGKYWPGLAACIANFLHDPLQIYGNVMKNETNEKQRKMKERKVDVILIRVLTKGRVQQTSDKIWEDLALSSQNLALSNTQLF